MRSVCLFGTLMVLVSTSAAAERELPRTVLTPSVEVIEGPVNGVLVHRRGRTLAIYGDPRPHPPRAARVLFADHRRDVAWAGRALVEAGAEAWVPAAEAEYFAGTRAFWERYRTARFHEYAVAASKVPAEPLREARLVAGGERIPWEGVSIEALATPGWTRGALSYLIEIDGKRIACVGGLIYGDGRILDLYSLQDAIPEAKEDGYHGWAARAADVIASLGRVAEWKPGVLVPARGPVIRNPQAAIERLTGRLRAVFTSHFEIDALRWYRGDERLRIQASRVVGHPVEWMPIAPVVQEKLPEWIVPISNSRLIVSASGAAYLVDCGSTRIIEQVVKLQQAGRFQRLEGIFVTHYHDDHTDRVQAAAERFQCPVYACAQMRDVLERPGAYRLPAQTANAVARVAVTGDGEKRRWHEFEFTYSYFPGQTLYHGGLLAKKDGGETIFFAGDSFTPTGMDDYCLLNRNFLAPEHGYTECFAALRKLPPDALLINQHVAPAFRFAPEQLERMARNFAARAALVRDLVPFDDPNYGLDDQWARFYPYGVETAAGRPFELRVAVLNHSPARREFRVRPHVPAGWKAPATVILTVPARAEATVAVPVVPAAGDTGVHVVTADVAFNSWDLREWAEALVDLR